MTGGWEALIVLAVFALVAVLGLLYGADSRPGVDDETHWWWQPRLEPPALTPTATALTPVASPTPRA